jgi:hypothetical protein
MTANNLREYQHLLATAERIDWRLDDVLALDARFDFTRPFLPEALACTAPLSFLDSRERLVLNHVRAASYLGLFGVIEEMILPFLVDHVRKTTLESLTTVRALLQFASEESKHIALFRRFRDTFERGFGHPCQLVGPAPDFAAAVLMHPPLSVALAILHIEWMTQRHWIEAVHDDSALEPAFVRLLRYHWMEEAQHARLDDLIVRELASTLDDTAIARAIEGYASIVELLDGALGEQTSLDLVAFQRATGRLLDDEEHAAYRIVSRKATRAGFLVAGMTHPQFVATVNAIAPTAAPRLDAIVRSYT